MNPLLTDWKTTFGVPPFAEIEDSHFEEALRAGMAEQRAEIDAVVGSPEPPGFADAIEALERSGAALRRVARVFFGLNSSHSSSGIRELAQAMAPELAAHRDDILLRRELFERVKAVHDRRDELELDVEQRRLLEETYKDFVRAGVGVAEEAQARLREVNGELAALSQRFGHNLLEETNDFELHVESREDLGDLPESLAAAAAEEARRRGREAGWSFTLTRPSLEPFLRHSPNRELRERLFQAYARLASRDGDRDNRAVLARIAALRAERARLLGYDTHAHYVLSDNMAQTPGRVAELLDQLWPPALAVARSERRALREMMRADGEGGELEGWDWRYYAERVRRARYDLDEESLRPYFELSAVRDGAFLLAEKLFGLGFTELTGLPTWHPDQQVFEVRDPEVGHLGVLYMDFYTRESKRDGAWMNELREQSKQGGEVAPIVTITTNFPPPAEGSPSLLSFSEVQTLFHEFGHALHALLSDVTYASLAGTNVARDFVEFPSQVIENWMSEPEVLRLYARHFETGEVIPEELIRRIKAAEKHGQGFATVEYLAASYLDLAWHGLAEAAPAPEDFERREMERIGMLPEILPRYRSPYFRHVFGGGYAAGYYSYIWSEVLDADAFEAFREAGLFDPETAGRYRRLLSQGNTRPGMELYREFRGRDPVIEPLLERRGLTS